MRTLDITAEQWRARARNTDAARFAAVVEPVAGPEGLSSSALVEAHLPLAELAAGLVLAHRARWQAVAALAPAAGRPRPYLIGLTGAVAAGKTVTAEVLVALLGALGHRTGVVSTDGFLLPNAELERRGLAARKGFPESYDHPALVSTIAGLADAGRDPAVPVTVPVYDHGTYDVTGARTEVDPGIDIVIVEGVNVLQPRPDRSSPGGDVADHLDLSVYLDADGDDLRAWFLQRLRRLRAETAGDPRSFYAGFSGLSDAEFGAMGEAVWAGVNEPNLADHIAPSRNRADVVVEKAADHAVRHVRLRLA